LSGAAAEPLADPDGDGISNVLDWAEPFGRAGAFARFSLANPFADRQVTGPLKAVACALNRALPASGLVVLTWGNVSGIDRASGLVAIKPSGVGYGKITPDPVVLVDLDGRAVLQRRHAPITWGPTPAKALANRIALEICARMAIDTIRLAPDTAHLPARFPDKHFLRKHGENAYYGQR
jgi:ribulose-5-phosphate 4-epimerase/fuculose-1-phosphate aldolase